MTASTKSALMLFSTLLIGMLLGSLITGAVNNRRMRSLAEMRSARGLAIRFEDMVRPENEEQREEIRAVLDQAAPKFAAVMLESRERMRSLRDSVRAELDPLLTEEQRERLEEGMRIGPRGAPGGLRPEDDRRHRRPRPEGNREPGIPPPAGHDGPPSPPPKGEGAR